jgi:hypothetical protein
MEWTDFFIALSEIKPPGKATAFKISDYPQLKLKFSSLDMACLIVPVESALLPTLPTLRMRAEIQSSHRPFPDGLPTISSKRITKFIATLKVNPANIALFSILCRHMRRCRGHEVLAGAQENHHYRQRSKGVYISLQTDG